VQKALTMVTEFGRSAYGDGVVPEDEYFERTQQIAALGEFLARAGGGEIAGGLIEGLRGVGKTDLIRRTIPCLLKKTPAVVVYYPVQPYTLEIFELARGFANTFIRQYRYSRYGEAADLQECVDAWYSRAPQCKKCTEPVLREICEAMGRAYVLRDVSNTLSLLVNAPRYLAELLGQRCVVILDHARHLRQVHCHAKAVPLLRQLLTSLESRVAPLFLADSSVGLRTMLAEQSANEPPAAFALARLDQNEALAMLETLCERFGVDLSIQLAERVLAQLGGLPFYIHSLVRRAHLSGLALDTTDQFGRVYAQEVRDGTIHWYWRGQFSTQFPQTADWQKAAELCSHVAGHYPQRAPLARLSERLSLEPAKLQQIMRHLHFMGVLDQSFGTVGLVDDPVLRDVVTVLAWGESSATTDAELLRRLAARRVREASTPPDHDKIPELLSRLKDWLQTFRGQYLPAEWFHYHEDYGAGWAGPEGIRRSLRSSDTLVRLPYLMAVSRMETVQTSGEPSVAHPIALCASGFRDKQLTPGNETQWLVVVWPTTDPLGIEHVNRTQDLRNEVAQRTGREVSRTWLIGKATFTREAYQLSSQLQFFTGNMSMVNYILDQMLAPGSTWTEGYAHARTVPEMIVTQPASVPVENGTEIPLTFGRESQTATEQEQKRQEAGG